MSYVQYRKRRRLHVGMQHLTRVIGRVPVAFLYFAPGDEASETELKAFAAAAKALGDQIRCFGVVRVRSRRMLYQLKRRLRRLKLPLRILLDWRGALAQATLTRKLPSYAAVNKRGHLRVAQASSLAEHITPHQSLLSLLKQLAQNKPVPSLRAPGYSPNPYRLLHQKAKRFALPRLFRKGIYSLPAKAKRPTLLFFWSVQCPHCRRIVPSLHAYFLRHRMKWSLQTLVQAPTPGLRRKLRRYLKKHKLTLPLLQDRKGAVTRKFHVQSYPTYILLDKNRTIRAVHLGATPPPQQVIPSLLRALP